MTTQSSQATWLIGVCRAIGVVDEREREVVEGVANLAIDLGAMLTRDDVSEALRHIMFMKGYSEDEILAEVKELDVIGLEGE